MKIHTLAMRTALAVSFVLLTGLLSPPSASALPAASEPEEGEGWRLVGSWQTLANGDDILALLSDGEEIWAGGATGGLMRWRRDGSLARQYLAPQDGLPCNEVRDIQRWQGRLYLATCRGLAYYDPGRDRVVGLDTGLSSDSVTALAVDARDRLWLAMAQSWDPDAAIAGKNSPGGYVGGGVAYTGDGLRWTTYAQANGLASDNARDIEVWRGDVWVATEPHRRWQPDQNDPGGEIDPGHWRIEGGGISQLTVSGWQRHDSSVNNSLADGVRHLAVSPEAIWAGTWGRGLQAYNGARWTAYRDCDSDTRCIQSDYVTALAVGGDGAIWVGTARFNEHGTGLNILDARGTPADDSDDAWHALRAANGMPGDLIRSLLPDQDGSVWIGISELDEAGRAHGRGLARLLGDRQTIDLHSTRDSGKGGLPDNDITALVRHGVTGELWVGTNGDGLAVRDSEGRWRSYTRANTSGGLASDNIADIVVEPGGIVWVATRQVSYDRAKGIWTDGGLSRFDGLAWSKMTTADGLPSNHLSSLALDGRGKLWVGTGATDRGPKEMAYRGWGLAVVNTQTRQWERTFNHPTLTSDNISDLAVADGKLYVATSYFFYVDPRPLGAQFSTGGGLSVLDLDTGGWRKIGADQGLSFAVFGSTGNKLIDLRAIQVDGAGQIWLAGLSYPAGTFDPDIQPDGVVDLLRGDAVTSYRFSGAGAVRALAIDRADNLWAGSALDGVRVRVENSWIRQAASAGGLPSDRLTALAFDGDAMWVGTAGDGLVQLVPPGLSPDGDPTVVHPIVWRLPYQIYLPHAFYAFQPRIVEAP